MAAAIVVVSTAVTAVPTATVMVIPAATVMAIPAAILMTPVIASWRRLVITRCRLINPRLVVIPWCWLVIPCWRGVVPAWLRVVTAAACIGRSTVIIGWRGIDLGTVITGSSIGIGHACTKRQSQYSNQKNSQIHGGLLDRE
jgi:hypothetical protein